MVKVYAVALVLGVLGMLTLILGGALSEGIGRPDRDPGEWLGSGGKVLIGAVSGFGMGGLSAEFSPLDLSWQLALLIAVVAAGASILWVRYSVTRTGD